MKVISDQDVFGENEERLLSKNHCFRVETKTG